MTAPARPRPLALGHLSLLDVPPPELARIAASAGFAAIGLRLHPAFPGSPFHDLPAGSTASRDMKACLAGDGVAVHDVEFVAIDAAFEPASVERLLASAGELGARTLSVCGDDPDPARLAANFAALCDLAARHGMGVDLEFMPWRRVATVTTAVGVVRAAGRANGGVLVDALHLARSGGAPVDLAGVSDELLATAQICDAPLEMPDSIDAVVAEARGGRLPPGDGALPLEALIAALPARTILSVEVPMARGGTPTERAALLFRKTTALLERCAR